MQTSEDTYSRSYDNWYALFVFTGREEYVKKMLEKRLAWENCENIRAVIPKRRLRERKEGIWRDVEKPLFPGYILLNGIIGTTEYKCIKDIWSFKRILSNNNEFSIITPDEMKILRKLTYNDDVIGFSKVLVEGAKVQVIEGPLLSLEGLIQSIDSRKGRAKVALSFLGEMRTVDLGVNILKTLQ
ncbi:MAG: antiterminator LoaP [Bacillota bacterium]